MLAGVLALAVTMSLHPHGPEWLEPSRFGAVAARNVFAHGLGLLSAPLLFVGALALTVELATPLALAGLVLQGFALGAVALAATASGLVFTDCVRERLGSTGAEREAWSTLLHYTFVVNQACARVFVVGGALALVAWSLELVRTRRFGRGLGYAGCAAAALELGILGVHPSLDVHAFGLVALCVGAWNVAAAFALWRGPKVNAPPAESPAAHA